MTTFRYESWLTFLFILILKRKKVVKKSKRKQPSKKKKNGNPGRNTLMFPTWPHPPAAIDEPDQADPLAAHLFQQI